MEGRRLKRGKKEERIRGGQSKGKVNKEWGKKERIVADQERSNKENLSLERQQHKKYQHIEYEESKVWTWLEKIHLSRKI